jgi:hypothetical protein
VLSSFRKLPLHHDNAPAHCYQIVQDHIAANDVQIVPHPPYYRPSDFWLFPKLNESLQRHHFSAEFFFDKLVEKFRFSVLLSDWCD